MILLVGLPPRRLHGLPAFQDIDLERVFGTFAKWVATVPSAAHLPAMMARAFRAVTAERSGPVVIGLPEDVLSEIADQHAYVRTARIPIPPQPAALDAIRSALAFAERPLVVIGGTEWSEEAAQNLAQFAERFDLPVVTAFRRQAHFDNGHPCYVGHAGLALDRSLAAGLKACDLVIAIGTRLGDVTTQGFTLLSGRPDSQKIIHIAPDAGSMQSTVPAALAVQANCQLAAAALADLALPGKRPPWGIWRRDLNAAYLASLKPVPTPGDVQLEYVVAVLRKLLPEDAIVTNGAGNYAAFVHRYFTYRMFGTQLAPVSGSMGYGLPAAIAAKLARPTRTVVAFAGDGCLQMTSQELLTAVQFGLNIILIVANNGMLATIRMHQEQRYPGRVVATSLLNPNFTEWAESCGAAGFRVASNANFADAFQQALQTDRPAVIELPLDGEAISPDMTITSIRGTARAAVSKQDDF